MDATSLQEFREQFNAIGNRDASLDAYVKTIVQIWRLEDRTDSSLEGRLGDVIATLTEMDSETVQQLEILAPIAASLSDGYEKPEDAVETALELQKKGFDLELSQALASRNLL